MGCSVITATTTATTTSPKCEELSVYDVLITHSPLRTLVERKPRIYWAGPRAPHDPRKREKQSKGKGDGGGGGGGHDVAVGDGTARWEIGDSGEWLKRERGVPFPPLFPLPSTSHIHARIPRVFRLSLFLLLSRRTPPPRLPRFHRYERGRRSPTILEKRSERKILECTRVSACASRVFRIYRPAIDRRGPPISRAWTILNFGLRSFHRRFPRVTTERVALRGGAGIRAAKAETRTYARVPSLRRREKP